MVRNLCLSLSIFLIISCKKNEPKVDFTLEKSTYFAGETIHLAAIYQHEASFDWSFSNGDKHWFKNLDYTIPADFKGGQLEIKLTVKNNISKRKHEVSKSITVISNGNVAFVNYLGSPRIILVSSYGGGDFWRDTLYVSSAQGASCGDQTAANFNLPFGKYSFNCQTMGVVFPPTTAGYFDLDYLHQCVVINTN